MARPRLADPHRHLARALIALCGEGAILQCSSMTPWASATFVGARHAFQMLLTGPDAPVRVEGIRDMLPDHVFRIPGHLVADILCEEYATDSDAAGDTCVRMTIAALTVEDSL